MDTQDSTEIKAHLLERLSLRELAEEAGAVFHGSAAGRRSSHCPLHGGDNPHAFHLYQSETRWHCFTRCPAGHNDGDLFAFYMAWKQVDFPTALHNLAARANTALPLRPPPSAIQSPPSQQWRDRAEAFLAYARSQLLDRETGAAARAYLFAERGLGPEAWQAFRLGYNPHEIYDDARRWGCADGKQLWLPRGLVIPGDFQGRLWSVKVRRPLPGDLLAEYIPPVTYLPKVKFRQLRGSTAQLFGCDLWIGFPVLLLVEGEWDAMLAWQKAGDLCDVATPGSASERLDPLDLALLARYRVILAAYDADPAGAAARRRLPQAVRLEQIDAPGHDLCDYWRGGGDLRAWIAGQVAGSLEAVLAQLEAQRHARLAAEIRMVQRAAVAACQEV